MINNCPFQFWPTSLSPLKTTISKCWMKRFDFVIETYKSSSKLLGKNISITSISKNVVITLYKPFSFANIKLDHISRKMYFLNRSKLKINFSSVAPDIWTEKCNVLHIDYSLKEWNEVQHMKCEITHPYVSLLKTPLTPLGKWRDDNKWQHTVYLSIVIVIPQFDSCSSLSSAVLQASHVL